MSRASDEISLADHNAMRAKVSGLPLESNLNDWMAKAVGMEAIAKRGGHHGKH